MNINIPKIPFYIKYFTILGSVVLTSFILVYFRSFFNPLLLAIIFALCLSPLAAFFERWMPRLLSSLICVVFITLLLIILFLIISYEIGTINLDINSVLDKAGNYIDSIKQWFADKFNYSMRADTDLKVTLATIGKDVSSYVNYFISLTTGFITAFIFFLLSLFFLLYYRRFLVAFMYDVTDEKRHAHLQKVIRNIKRILKLYMVGLCLDIAIVALLNVIGLLLLGTPHAFFFGILAAVLLIIPYIGILIGASLPTLYMLMISDSVWYPIGVILIFSFVQVLEGNFIYPNIVGNKVGLNPFVIIMGLLLGGLLLGLVGIIVTIPLLSVIKVIFDNFKPLQPYGFLMGIPPSRLT